MKIAWLVPNQCWVVLFGDQVLAIEGRHFWPCKADLITALAALELRVDEDEITIDRDGKGDRIMRSKPQFR